jgi:hypothetical protein
MSSPFRALTPNLKSKTPTKSPIKSPSNINHHNNIVSTININANI